MRLLAGLTIIATFLLASTSARAQTSGVNDQSQRAQGCAAYLPLNTNLKITLKDGRKIKGRLLARRDDQFEISVRNQAQTVTCADVARVEKSRGFGHRLRVAAGNTVIVAGIVVAMPGLLIAWAGAEDVGLIIATPGLGIAIVGDSLAGNR
ncbi:MAG: hypothetical protein ACREBD_13420 [Blastocatellia bacterium]